MKYIAIASILALMSATVKADDDYATGAYKLLKSFNVAMVSTLGECENEKCLKPYGSVMPYALDDKGQPIVFISDLAVHTDNINANPNASLMVFKPDAKGNVFNGSRVTLNGKFRKVSWEKDKKEHERLSKIYVKEHPDAKQLLEFADFNFYVLEIRTIYYIGGFGEIGTVEVKDYQKAIKPSGQ
jgi:putative heme iron utilization protein